MQGEMKKYDAVLGTAGNAMDDIRKEEEEKRQALLS